MRIALHTTIRLGNVEAYEAAHSEVPAELTAAIREAGCTSWTIWRSGLDLFHVIDCEDYETLIAHVGAQHVNASWQARMAELLDVAHDYSAGDWRLSGSSRPCWGMCQVLRIQIMTLARSRPAS